MSDQAAVLKDDLTKKLNDLKSIIQHPQLFVAEHFTSLRREIDLAIEAALQETQSKSEEPKQPPNTDPDETQINSIRDAMITELTKHEKQFLENVTNLVSASSWIESQSTLKTMEEKVESEFAGQVLDPEECYEKLATQILDEKSKLERLVFEQQTFMFFHGAKNPGILLHLPNVYLSGLEISCLR